jgi:hypothetical protein
LIEKVQVVLSFPFENVEKAAITFARSSMADWSGSLSFRVTEPSSSHCLHCFIIVRGLDGETIFRDDQDREKLLIGDKMLRVKRVVPKEDYTLEIELSNDKKGIFDIKQYLNKGTFTELKDLNYFKQVRPFFYGISWPHNQDLSIDTIEYEMRSV